MIDSRGLNRSLIRRRSDTIPASCTSQPLSGTRRINNAEAAHGAPHGRGEHQGNIRGSRSSPPDGARHFADAADRAGRPSGTRAMDLGLAGAAVVVQGGTKGMGRAAAECFAADGARVAVLARPRPTR